MGVSGKNDTGQIGAINSHRDGLAKLRRAEPSLFVFGKRCGGNLVEPYEFGIETRACIMSCGWRFLLQAVEVFGVESVDQMNFTAAEAEEFDVAIALNIKANGIEIRQRLSFLVFFPVIRIAPEKHVGTGAVIRNIEGAEDGHFLLRRMCGKNGDLIEEAFESRHRNRKGDDHRVW